MVGCASMANTATDFGNDLTVTILDQDDPEIVERGLPSYLLLIDTLIAREPHNAKFLSAGAESYNAYIAGFVDDSERRMRLADKAMRYADTLLCEHDRRLCQIRNLPSAQTSLLLRDIGLQDLPIFYLYASVWATWIQAHADNWDALAQLAHVESIMQRIEKIDEPFRNGGAHVYLGTLATLVPPAMGGNPERAKVHFERAVELSQGTNLMAKVLYAQHYARAIYDRELHDRLLREVLAASPQSTGLTLSNSIAQRKAKVLLANADSYF